MDDVIIKLNEITMDIKNSALNLFSKVTGEILTQFIQGIKVNDEMKNSIKPDTLISMRKTYLFFLHDH